MIPGKAFLLALVCVLAAISVAGVAAASKWAQGIQRTAGAGSGSVEDKARAEALDAKFAALKTAGSAERSEVIVREIWAIWVKSGDADIDQKLRAAIAAMQDGERAIGHRLLDEIVRLKPDFPEGWNQRATLRFFEGRYEESLADCVEVLKREPRHFGALAGMGLIAMGQGRPKAALAAFRKALTLNPFLKERGLIAELEKRLEGEAL